MNGANIRRFSSQYPCSVDYVHAEPTVHTIPFLNAMKGRHAAPYSVVPGDLYSWLTQKRTRSVHMECARPNMRP